MGGVENKQITKRGYEKYLGTCHILLHILRTTGVTLIRLSRPMLNMGPWKNIFHIQVFWLLICYNPTHKIETASRWQTTNSIPLGPIKLCKLSETGSNQ